LYVGAAHIVINQLGNFQLNMISQDCI